MTVLVVLLCFLAATFTITVAARVGKAEFSEPTLFIRNAIPAESHGRAHVFRSWAATMGPGIAMSSVGLGPMASCRKDKEARDA